MLHGEDMENGSEEKKRGHRERGGERNISTQKSKMATSCNTTVASFPGPAQLSVAISTEKRERAWYLFSHE